MKQGGDRLVLLSERIVDLEYSYIILPLCYFGLKFGLISRLRWFLGNSLRSCNYSFHANTDITDEKVCTSRVKIVTIT